MILLAFIPSIIIGYLVYKSDTVEKEPVGELFKAICMGCFAVILTVAVSYLFRLHKIDTEHLTVFQLCLYSFIGVGLVEELSKWVSLNLFLHKNKEYNYIYDGIVYSVFVTLGFATVENVIYLMDADILAALIRCVITVPAHTFFAIFMGYYLSKDKYIKDNGDGNDTKYLGYSVIIPVLLHGLFDLLLLVHNVIIAYVFVGFVILLYAISVKQIFKAIEEEKPFKEETK